MMSSLPEQTALQKGTSDPTAMSLLKFALAALFGVPLCFALAFLVRRIPFVSKIL